MAASSGGHVASVRALLAGGAGVGVVDAEGRGALRWAHGRWEVVRELVVDPKPETRNLKHETRDTRHDTLCPTPYTLHPTPYTLHPTPYTLQGYLAQKKHPPP